MTLKTAIGGMFIRAKSSKLNSLAWLRENRIIDDLALSFTDDKFKLVAIDGQTIFGQECSLIKLFVFKMNYEDYEKESKNISLTFEENLHYLYDSIESNTHPSIELEPKFYDDITCIDTEVNSEDCYNFFLNWLN